MNKQQIIVIASAIALFFILYFGCDVKSKEQKAVAQSRELTADVVNINSLIENATASLNPSQKADIQSLTQKAENNTPSVLKQLSGAWHDIGREEIAAYYAEKVAEIEKTEEAWSIAGANYYLAIQQNTEQNIRDFCTQKATNAFQNAISTNPSNLDNRINLALCYTENPPKDNPMKGILQLRELDKENPENIPVNVQLARLAIKTGQFDRAIERLEKMEAKEPNNKRVLCLLADAYQGGNNPKAAEMLKKCESLK
jgi:thioredoxin-like negative regulator of GroEL